MIDHMGPGGAQRQMSWLIRGLAARGHAVELLIYHATESFFLDEVEAVVDAVHAVWKGRGFSPRVVLAIAELLRTGRFDVAISYLHASNAYLALAATLAPGTPILTSERSSGRGEDAFFHRVTRLAHRRADGVIANSFAQRDWLMERYSRLRGRTHAIWNGYASDTSVATIPDLSPPVLLVVGRIGPEKNGLRLAEALEDLHRQGRPVPHVLWAGRDDVSPSGSRYAWALRERVEQSDVLRMRWKWLGVRSDIPALLTRVSALVHPSLYEGLPNAICEALLAGLPVLASKVCDHPLLVGNGERGELFDPLDAADIAQAIDRFLVRDLPTRRAMGHAAREWALRNLSQERMLDEYERICRDVTRGGGGPPR